MTDDASASAVQAFYDDHDTDEWERLATGIDGRLEFESTTRALESHLPETARVLDAGAGAGRYAIWLAEHGYEVTALDLSREQVALAREQVRRRGLADRISVVQGSITDLSLPASAFDATCCLELRRVTRSGGPVAVSVLGRLGTIQLYLAAGYQLEALPALFEHGDYDAETLERYGYEPAFAPAHLFRRAELRSLLAERGLSVRTVRGLEGLGSVFHRDPIRETLAGDDATLAGIRETVATTNDDPTVADLSVHMLAVGTA
ncbi:class I SAM-dependent methyltransferase [Halobacteriales archaeon QH_10_67_13]|nr:MAG: class I SAM-dependent methyltransferase [Halobacteriales archaeon QH_10_67_13]